MCTISREYIWYVSILLCTHSVAVCTFFHVYINLICEHLPMSTAIWCVCVHFPVSTFLWCVYILLRQHSFDVPTLFLMYTTLWRLFLRSDNIIALHCLPFPLKIVHSLFYVFFNACTFVFKRISTYASHVCKYH